MIQHPEIIREYARDRIDRYRHQAAIQRAIGAIPHASAAAGARRWIAAAIRRFALWIDVDVPAMSGPERPLAFAR